MPYGYNALGLPDPAVTAAIRAMQHTLAQAPGGFLHNVRKLESGRAVVGGYVARVGGGGAVEVIHVLSGQVVSSSKGSSSFGRVFSGIVKGIIVAGVGLGFGHAAAALIREAAWYTVKGAIAKAAVASIGAFLAPAVPGYYITRQSTALGLLFGLGGWAGSGISHARAAIDLIPQSVRDIASKVWALDSGPSVLMRNIGGGWTGSDVLFGLGQKSFATRALIMKQQAALKAKYGGSVWNRIMSELGF